MAMKDANSTLRFMIASIVLNGDHAPCSVAGHMTAIISSKFKMVRFKASCELAVYKPDNRHCAGVGAAR
jgi:hypothetical protein